MAELKPAPAQIPTIQRYLQRYAEPLAKGFHASAIAQFESVIVIPIYDEAEATLKPFLAFSNGRRTLMIWVFNAPESAAGTMPHIRTRQVMQALLTQLNPQALNETCYLADVHKHLQVLIVDRCRQGIPDKQGVGLARKIGTDLALQLTYRQYLQSGQMIPWLYSTDADAALPVDYALLDRQELPEPKPREQNKSAISACVYAFSHRPEPGFEQAMRLYEFSLHYYVDQLAQAGSPYAFHTIGSLLAFTPLAYAQVRGVPKRAGAEDFYLLNKLAKVGRVATLTQPMIHLAGRASHRVPFGTGPALNRIQDQSEMGKPFHVYHPRIFCLLRGLLASVASIENSVADAPLAFFTSRDTMLTRHEIRIAREILDQLGWQKQIVHLQQKRTAEAWQAAFHTWFDAFLTLRFVHLARDLLYPNIDIAELPALLEAAAYTGANLDYIAWFKDLGISG